MWRHTHGGHLDERLIEHAAVHAAAAAEDLLARIVTLADRLDRRLVTLDTLPGASEADIARIARELRTVYDLIARLTGRLVDRLQITDRSGRWADADVVRVLDSMIEAIEADWPEAASARGVVVAALNAELTA